MPTAKPNNTWLILLVLLIGAWTLWPKVEAAPLSFWRNPIWFSLKWFAYQQTKDIVKPDVQPPKTRCLIFGFSSCPACRELHKTVRRLNGWKLGPLNTDDIEEIDIYSNDRRVSKYKHSSYPTLIIVDRGENEVSRKTGAMSAKELIAWIQSTR